LSYFKKLVENFINKYDTDKIIILKPPILAKWQSNQNN
jgi:hypothetical protein